MYKMNLRDIRFNILGYLDNPIDFYNLSQVDKLFYQILSTKHFWDIIFNKKKFILPTFYYTIPYEWILHYKREDHLNCRVTYILDSIRAIEFSDDICQVLFNPKTFNLSTLLNVDGVDIKKIEMFCLKLNTNIINFFDKNDIDCMITYEEGQFWLDIDHIDKHKNSHNIYMVELDIDSIIQIIYNVLLTGFTIKYKDADSILYDFDESSEDE